MLQVILIQFCEFIDINIISNVNISSLLKCTVKTLGCLHVQVTEPYYNT